MVYFNDSKTELTIAVWILFVMGIIIALTRGSSKQREVMLIYMAMFGTYHIVFDSLANIKNPSGIHHGVLERFWLQPSLALCCVAGCGVGMIFQFLKEKASCPALKYLFLSLAVIAIGYQIQHNYEDCNENDNYFFWHYSRHILDQLPNRSILVTAGDSSANTFRYHTIGEEYRTDVMVMDVEFMKSNWFYTILAPINFPDVSFPGLYKAGKESKYPYYNLKMFLDENYDKFPIYMCLEVPKAEDSIEGYYEAWPFGMCKVFVRVSDNRDPLEHVTSVPWINLEKYPLPDPDRYEPKTWEYTMAMSMLRSYETPATWLWNKAKSMADKALKKKYLETAMNMMVENRKHVFDMVEKGLVTKNVVYYISPLEKRLGHLSLIFYSMTRREDPEMASFWTAECKKYYTNYVEWHRDSVIRKDFMWDTINSIIKLEDFSGIQFD